MIVFQFLLGMGIVQVVASVVVLIGLWIIYATFVRMFKKKGDK